MSSKELTTMKVFPKGQVVIPVSLRKKYHIDIGDQIKVISTPDGILLKPERGKKDKPSLTDLLFGTFNKYSSTKQILSNEKITRATEKGFLNGWKE